LLAGAENSRIDVVLVLNVAVLPNYKSCGLSLAGDRGAGRDLTLSTAMVKYIFIGVIVGADDNVRRRVVPGGIAFDNDAVHLDEYVWLVVRCRGLPAKL
jgi:hypothetical protein